ncbi:hypothetical protein [Actinomadura madurae]|uniref:hypothetical protein n=1 Tax=Actinomadura madurae TaxID=1993 RepID=UPI0020D24D5F|nr:hypothetical protein [Actinomadura madurae]MCP9984023.1 hypothetical protein [Actinomadura madurae]
MRRSSSDGEGRRWSAWTAWTSVPGVTAPVRRSRAQMFGGARQVEQDGLVLDAVLRFRCAALTRRHQHAPSARRAHLVPAGHLGPRQILQRHAVHHGLERIEPDARRRAAGCTTRTGTPAPASPPRRRFL